VNLNKNEERGVLNGCWTLRKPSQNIPHLPLLIVNYHNSISNHQQELKIWQNNPRKQQQYTQSILQKLNKWKHLTSWLEAHSSYVIASGAAQENVWKTNENIQNWTEKKTLIRFCLASQSSPIQFEEVCDGHKCNFPLSTDVLTSFLTVSDQKPSRPKGRKQKKCLNFERQGKKLFALDLYLDCWKVVENGEKLI
jgi:hypothetical protein